MDSLIYIEKICKQYIDKCRTNELLLNDMISFIKQFENKKDNDYEYDLFKSVGDVLCTKKIFYWKIWCN